MGTRPTVGGSEDVWGYEVNTALDEIEGKADAAALAAEDASITAATALAVAESISPGAADHSELGGLADGDDHPQYLNTTRGDARYYSRGEADALLAAKASSTHGHVVSDVIDLQTTLDGKAPSHNPTFTGSVSGVTKAHVGLSNVNNTSDADKQISTATQTALNAKASLAGATFTGTVNGISKAMVGLGNVDNTSDASKPISTATQAALNLKAPLASPTFTGTVSGVTKAHVGLGNVDNTADTAKPVSTAQQTAIDARVPKTWAVRPVIYADSSTTVPNRATWIAANAPGYTGPVDWNVAQYLDHPGPLIANMVAGDMVVDRVSA